MLHLIGCLYYCTSDAGHTNIKHPNVIQIHLSLERGKLHCSKSGVGMLTELLRSV